MRIERLDPADAVTYPCGRVGGVVAIWRAAHEADLARDPMFCPSWEFGRIHHPLPGEITEHWFAVDGDELVGIVETTLPLLDNLGTAFISVTVAPGARRRGFGRALYGAAADRARAQGRKLAMFESQMGGAGEAFARSLGSDLGIHSARRRLVVDAAVLRLADELDAAATPHAGGYEIRTYRGDVPDAYVADLSYLTGRMSTDAPLDDLALEPVPYDTERLRGEEKVFNARGRRLYTAVAVQAETGRVVGYTNAALTPEDPTHAWQWDTIVDPDHRGHRLGTLIKTANLRFLLEHEPLLATIMTWNAVSNGPMIAVNEAMGFRLWDHWGEWQVEL
jgi:GNAT superfamily N-acetyltransferase